MTKLPCVLLLFTVVFGQKWNEDVFRFSNVFGDHMVLQQAPKRASVWGYGEVGQEVIVIFSGDMYRSFVVQQTHGEQSVGVWTVMLAPTAVGGPHQIEAHSMVKGMMTTITLDDVMFGDVWICSGQSNMAFTVSMSDDGAKAVNESAQYQNIRIFTAACDCKATPQMELTTVELPWSRPSPETLGGPHWLYFSAVCWYYGVELYKKLKYPIGLIATSYGGTPIEAWSSPDAFATCGLNQTAKMVDYRKLTEPEDVRLNGPRNHSCLWNAMIVPFLNVTIYGSIWYQGEANAPARIYNCTFPAMIDDWRAKWYVSTQHNTDPTFPFGFVQLSAVGNGTGSLFGFASIRWDQTARYGYVPNPRQKNVFMAVAMDLGNPKSPYSSVHPTDKTDVGKRLALAGMAVAYSQEGVYYTGPLVSSIKRQTHSPSPALEVVFKSLNEKIEVRSRKGFEVHCQNSTGWMEAPIVSYGTISVTIMPKSLKCVVDQVRYAWSDDPCPKLECAVYSGGLPSPPFMVDGPFGVVAKSLQLRKLFPIHV